MEKIMSGPISLKLENAADLDISKEYGATIASNALYKYTKQNQKLIFDQSIGRFYKYEKNEWRIKSPRPLR